MVGGGYAVTQEVQVFDDRGEMVTRIPILPDSVGWKRAGMSGEASPIGPVNDIKRLCAATITLMANHEKYSASAETRRDLRIAMEHLEAAQMFAVRGIIGNPSLSLVAQPNYGDGA